MCVSIGQFQKISISYHGWLLEIPRAMGVLWTGNLKAWGILWNSKGKGLETDKSLFLKNAYFIDWFSWQMNWQHWQHRVQYKHRLIRQSMFLCSFVEENRWSSATGDNAFWKVRRPGEGIKYGSRLWYGMDISWNCPLQYSWLYIFY